MHDARVRAVKMTSQGRVMTEALDAARQKVIEQLLAGWKAQEVRDLARLLRKVADDALEWTKTL
jgi:DNA-binding MarR family transcriptional regulator